MKLTSGKSAQILGAVATRRSTPFRYVSRDSTTMVTVSHEL